MFFKLAAYLTGNQSLLEEEFFRLCFVPADTDVSEERRRHFCETFLAIRNVERWLYSQATLKITFSEEFLILKP